MTEILLNKVLAFNTGFVIESQQQLNIGTTYYLTIGTGVTDKPYIPTKNGSTIIDSWTNVGYTPPDGNLCFTLIDQSSGCPPINCTLTVT